jgi:hypothetical protein
VKYFDVHLHLPSPDTKGLDAFLRHLDGEPHMMGGNLILNTPKEVDFVSKNLANKSDPVLFARNTISRRNSGIELV